MTRNPWRRDRRPLAIAHRGHSIEVPENTLEAYRKAIELGAEMIECDVHITRDGYLVMMHDSTLDRTTNGTGRVSSATWEELQRLDAGRKFSPDFAGLRIPSTEATLLLYKEAGIIPCFEIKGADDAEAMQIAKALVELILKYGMLERTFVSSYYHPAMALAKSLAPELLLAPERLPDDGPPDPPEALRQAQALGAPVLQYQHTVLVPEVVRLLHDHDVALWSWTTNDERSMVYSIEFGADALMGDDVRLMLDVLNRLRPLPARM